MILFSKNNKLNVRGFIKNFTKGAVLIEFAFALPILLVLIYYVYDLHNQKQMQEKMKFVSMELASILQNIPHEVTQKDVANAIQAAYLSFFPGNTMFKSAGGDAPLGYYPFVTIMLIKGEIGNQASGKWMFKFWSEEKTFVCAEGEEESNLGYSIDLVPASSFWPGTTIAPDEYKVIIQCAVYCDRKEAKSTSSSSKSGDEKQTVGEASERSVFGFFVIRPSGVGKSESAFFPATVVFTPKPRLFSDTLPPE